MRKNLVDFFLSKRQKPRILWNSVMTGFFHLSCRCFEPEETLLCGFLGVNKDDDKAKVLHYSYIYVLQTSAT